MNSRRNLEVLLIIVAAIAFAVPAAYAQGVARRGRGRLYVPSAETTVTGTVAEVNTIPGRRGQTGTHLDLKTESGTLDVHVGPSAFLAAKHFTFAKGDRIEVTGSKVMHQGHEAIIAREIKMNGKTLTLRNAQGIPEWAGGWRR
jgi:DNA/RNA endonuclease YhcR with UshA esterase domain